MDFSPHFFLLFIQNFVQANKAQPLCFGLPDLPKLVVG